MDWNAQQACDDDVRRTLASGAFHQALETLVQGYQQAVVGFCVNMVGDSHHGEDIAQDVFLAVYKAMPRFRQQASVRTWLFAIARRQCLKAMRDRRRRHRLEHERQKTIAATAHRNIPETPEDDPERQLQLVKQGLTHLGKHERALLLMRYDTGLLLTDVAHILGISEASVRRRLARALRHLREVMNDAA